MKKKQRQKKMLDILRDEGPLSVNELAERLQTSLSTIYRDIRDLESQKSLIHTTEMRVAYPGEHLCIPVHHKKDMNKGAKISIAKQAVKLIPSGATIYFDSSSTVSCMIEFLVNRQDITVLTSSIYIAELLIKAKVPAYFCGGKLLENAQTLWGGISQIILRSMPIDYVFFSPQAINKNGIIFDRLENSSRRNALTHAKYSVCLCDKTKFDKTSAFRAASVQDIDYLITDAILPSDYMRPRIEMIFA